ncbi:hypothetical protein Ocin01_15986 [Orchesella cincta]|uniref:Uncharacterized protein n=1 Tax=Orchesella cincta TaxID=48709 RepID=A0A1D2MCH2_ORCCI|nr:hypothetical protein Ocin01_15986 [Orchesella cincta]
MSLLSMFRRLFGLDPPPPVKSFGGLPPLIMLSPSHQPIGIQSSPSRSSLKYIQENCPPPPSSSMDCAHQSLGVAGRVEMNRNDLLRYRHRLLQVESPSRASHRAEDHLQRAHTLSRNKRCTNWRKWHAPRFSPSQSVSGWCKSVSLQFSSCRDCLQEESWRCINAFFENCNILGRLPHLLQLYSRIFYQGSCINSWLYANLKRLGLPWVIVLDDVTKPTFAFPPPPSLPQLTTLDLKSYSPGWEDTHDSDSDMVLSIWMILSYADQLERLTVWAEYPLPALEQNKEYYHYLDAGARIFIAPHRIPHLESSLSSKSPDPTRASSSSLNSSPSTLHRDFNLQHISLDVTWPELPIGGPNCFNDLDPKELEPSPSMIALPLVKTLVLTYAAFYEKVIVNKTLNLGKFPALEKLHLLRFSADVFEPETDEEEVLGSEYEALVTETVGYPPRIVDRVRSLRGLINGVRTRIKNNMAIVVVQRRQMVISHKRMFEDLRENDEENSEDIGRKLFEREGIWNSCPKLKIVPISFYGRSDGSYCIIRRLED